MVVWMLVMVVHFGGGDWIGGETAFSCATHHEDFVDEGLHLEDDKLRWFGRMG